MSKVGIIGAGAWGTALACAMKRAGNDVIIYAHEKETADAINSRNINTTFLPEITLDSTIRLLIPWNKRLRQMQCYWLLRHSIFGKVAKLWPVFGGRVFQQSFALKE